MGIKTCGVNVALMTSQPHYYIMNHQVHFHANAETSTNVIKMFLGNILNYSTSKQHCKHQTDATCCGRVFGEKVACLSIWAFIWKCSMGPMNVRP